MSLTIAWKEVEGNLAIPKGLSEDGYVLPQHSGPQAEGSPKPGRPRDQFRASQKEKEE